MISIIECLIWIAASIGIGCCLVELCAARSCERLGALGLALGFGLGVGSSACLYFISLLIFGGASLAFVWMNLALLTVLLILRVLLYRNGGVRTPSPPSPFQYRDALIPILAITAVVFILTVFLRSSTFIHGGWDAWTFWNLRARWIFRSGADWPASVFSPLLANTDYPLLLPSTTVQAWNLLGTETVYVPVSIGIAFELGTVALLLAVLWRFSSPMKSILGMLLLMATPLFIDLGAYQYGDVPIAYFFLSTLTLIGLHDSAASDRKEWLALAGFAAGLCCWTKNEGMLFAGSVIIARIFTARLSGWRNLAKELLYIVVGAGVPVAVLFYFRHAYAPPSVMFGSQTVRGFISQIFEAPRHAMILRAFIRSVIGFGGFGNWKISPLPFMAIYAAVAGFNKNQRYSRFLSTCLVSLLLMLAGYYAVYLTEGIPAAKLQQHLDTSLDRLMFQLWPMFILTYFLAVRNPLPQENVAHSQPSPESWPA